MPRTKKQTKSSQGFLSQIKWGESYTSLILGAVVVIVGLILLFSFLKAKTNLTKETGSSATNMEQSIKPSSYVVKQGDDLWTISQKLYGSGYNWVDLASANNLKNPNVLFVGTNLKVPDVKTKTVEQPKVVSQKQSITENRYVVVKGDNLWDIAIRAYGDGYKWVEIAKANKLANPNLIHPGNVFVLPR